MNTDLTSGIIIWTSFSPMSHSIKKPLSAGQLFQDPPTLALHDPFSHPIEQLIICTGGHRPSLPVWLLPPGNASHWPVFAYRILCPALRSMYKYLNVWDDLEMAQYNDGHGDLRCSFLTQSIIVCLATLITTSFLQRGWYFLLILKLNTEFFVCRCVLNSNFAHQIYLISFLHVWKEWRAFIV